MNSRLIVGLCSTALLGFAVAFTAPVSAQEKRTQSCNTQWRDMTKAEKKDLKKKDWVAECEAKADSGKEKKEAKKEKKEKAEKVEKTTTAPVTTPSSAGEVKGKPGRQAMIERERACGKLIAPPHRDFASNFLFLLDLPVRTRLIDRVRQIFSEHVERLIHRHAQRTGDLLQVLVVQRGAQLLLGDRHILSVRKPGGDLLVEARLLQFVHDALQIAEVRLRQHLR
jgi:hypothetical protein